MQVLKLISDINIPIIDVHKKFFIKQNDPLQYFAHRKNIIKEIATIVGGSGGGRPDMAQAGGTHTEKLDEALKKAEEIIKATP